MLLFYVMHFKTQRFLRQVKRKTVTTKKQNDIGRIESSSIKKKTKKTYHSVYGALS